MFYIGAELNKIALSLPVLKEICFILGLLILDKSSQYLKVELTHCLLLLTLCVGFV